MGEAVKALVQRSDGDALDDSALERELIEFCRERLSAFKRRRSVEFVGELPRLPTGKLAKRLLPTAALAPSPLSEGGPSQAR
jgi:long-chain acyl-CoA synthetase